MFPRPSLPLNFARTSQFLISLWQRPLIPCSSWLDPEDSDVSGRAHFRLIAGGGILIIILGAGSALLPVVDRDAGISIVGSLLLVAGAVEIFAGAFRREAKVLSVLAGAVTMFAGLLFVINAAGRPFPVALLVAGWLITRSITLLFAGSISAGLARTWTLFTAAIDFLLGAMLLMGLSVSWLVIAMFGPTSPIVAGFAWIFALSFVATGAMLLQVGRAEDAN